MMDASHVSSWMLSELKNQGCLYQDDVVDYLVKSNNESLLQENSAGNLVLTPKLLNSFRKLTEIDVVWVRSDRYWRYRVEEDDEGRDASG